MRISRRFGKPRKDCGTSGESFEMLKCEALLEFNSPRSHGLRPGESTTFLIGHFTGGG